MNETDTPETDEAWQGHESGPIFDRKIQALCRKLEREKNEARREAEAYAETIRQTLELLDEATAIEKPSRLAGILRERHANFAIARQSRAETSRLTLASKLR